MVEKSTMNYFWQLIIIVTFSSLSSFSLWSIDEKRIDFLKSLTHDMQVEIFCKLEIDDFSSITRVARAFDGEKFWKNLPFKDKDPRESWKEFYVRKKTVNMVLNVGKMNSNAIHRILQDENYLKYEACLLKNLEHVFIGAFKYEVQNLNDLCLCLLANYYINFNSARTAILAAAKDDVWHFARLSDYGAQHERWDAVTSAMKQDSLDRADMAIQRAAAEYTNLLFAKNDAFNEVCKAAYKDAWTAAGNKKGDKNNLDKAKLSDQDTLKLNKLFILAYISQSDFLTYSEKIFKIAKKELSSKYGFGEYPHELVFKWDIHTWMDENLENNPHIMSFKRLAFGLCH